MHPLRSGCLLALLAASCGGGTANTPDAAPAGPYPPLADLTRDIVDTTLAVDVAARTATATITLAPSTSVGASFEIGDLVIGAVRLGTAPLLWTDTGDQLDLGVPPSTGPLVVTIDYAWQTHGDSDGVSPNGYTLTWPYWCGNVFPCKSDPSDGTTFHLQVTGAAATSTIIFPTTIATEAPAYMAAWIVGSYTRLDLGQTTAGTRVAMWHLPGGATAARAGGAHLRDAFDWMERNLGPYRFGTEVGTVAARWGAGAYGGMEHHPYWHIGTAAMADEETNVHEAAHGWFGNGVRVRCWEDFVLSEGTVTYLAARVLEEVGSATLGQSVWSSYQAELDAMRAGTGNGVAWPQSCGQVDILKDGLFSRVPYVKGAYFYRALEERVGRVMFDRAVSTFYQRWAGKAAGMQDMLDVIEEVTGYDPQACARAWLIEPTVPALGPCA